MAHGSGSPLAGLRVVEVSLGVSAVGAGMAASLPGALLRDFGAEVIRVQSAPPSTLDAGVEFDRAWNHGKDCVEVDLEDGAAARTVAGLAGDADVLFITGDEGLVEGHGLVYHELTRSNPRLVAIRIRPSYGGAGKVPDLELLVHARAGLLTQIRGNRPGPVFGDLSVASAGAAFSATAGALACLYEREATGLGGWVETSLYDGMLAMLPMIIGRVEHPTPGTDLLWAQQGPSDPLILRCADGEYIQLWLGGKGSYEVFLDQMGEPRSQAGFVADLMSGVLAQRSPGWFDKFLAHDRAWWLERLAGYGAEPVLRPGEMLIDDHVRRSGLSIQRHDPERGTITVLGPVGSVTAAGGPRHQPTGRPPQESRLLSGVHVLDLSAYLAGPITPLVLAELGATVVKLEPPSGDPHRLVETMFAAGQRSKLALGLDLKAPGAADLLARLFRWSDVVHHNSRLGTSERVGYDEAVVRSANPDVVYSFASGFGTEGTRARNPADDHLMQALSGVEAGQGGVGQPPAYLVWGAADVASGWVSACAVIAGLYARTRTGRGQSVATSLLGAAMMLKSGALVAGDAVVEGPVLDTGQTGYGAAYRIYQCADDAWLALAIPDSFAWSRLREAVRLEELPAYPPPLRTDPSQLQPAEILLEQAFRSRDVPAWLADLSAAGVPVEAVVEADRREFISRVLDDPVNRQLSRVVSFPWGPLGLVEQPRFSFRVGPAPRPPVPAFISDPGEHTGQLLESLGIGADERARLVAAGTISGPST